MSIEVPTPETDEEDGDAKQSKQRRMQVHDTNTSAPRIFPIMTFSQWAAIKNACSVLRVERCLVGR